MISRRALFGLLAAAPFVKRRPKLGEPGNPVMGALPPAGATTRRPRRGRDTMCAGDNLNLTNIRTPLIPDSRKTSVQHWQSVFGVT